MIKSKTERIKWQEKADFKFRRGFDPEMFHAAEGVIFAELCRVLGQGKNSARVIREVVYDYDYCIAKLAKECFSKLQLDSKNQAIQLAEKAWDCYLSHKEREGVIDEAN